jgi:hypothetical protein
MIEGGIIHIYGINGTINGMYGIYGTNNINDVDHHTT